jgi:succinate dehydrogenase / fumarate reductase, cytochrome b subunit
MIAVRGPRIEPARARAAPGSWFARHSRAVLAASGFVMLGFVLLHLAGNLLAFAGSGPFNAYARALRQLGTPWLDEAGLLWLARVIVASALVLHLAAHIYRLRHPSDSASPRRAYLRPPPWYATLPLAFLQASGLVIALFVAFHVGQLTLGITHPAFVANDAYHNLLLVLRVWPISLAYILAAGALGIHLFAGIWTGLDGLGLVRPATEALVSRLAPAVALLVTVATAAAPVAVLAGVLK